MCLEKRRRKKDKPTSRSRPVPNLNVFPPNPQKRSKASLPISSLQSRRLTGTACSRTKLSSQESSLFFFFSFPILRPACSLALGGRPPLPSSCLAPSLLLPLHPSVSARMQVLVTAPVDVSSKPSSPANLQKPIEISKLSFVERAWRRPAKLR
ncbi:hypothetical protein B0T22DRAFT_308187 [Podospora appendiculata]|uniref:Uncharacterized protein n=1 Tax=Podospora appendiculata TaxID=314037 RepID=A0AAE0WZR3_9PEZI|nr:hypothetical protein B0T22DRAFT_308187 [Podospora appendiculata]